MLDKTSVQEPWTGVEVRATILICPLCLLALFGVFSKDVDTSSLGPTTDPTAAGDETLFVMTSSLDAFLGFLFLVLQPKK